MNALALRFALFATLSLGAVACGAGGATQIVEADTLSATAHADRAADVRRGSPVVARVSAAVPDVSVLSCDPAGGVGTPGDSADDGLGEPSPLPVRRPGG